MAIDFPNSPSTDQEYSVGSTTWVYDGSKWNVKTVVAYSNDSAPVGTLVTFAGTTAPAGWVKADGSSLSTSTYSQLFSVIGYTFGGSGASFSLPNIVGTTGIYIIRYTTTLGTVSTDSLYTAPVGTMMQWPITSSYPTGWLRSDGSAVSRTTYADLFALLSTTYGDGTTTPVGGGATFSAGAGFNLPNLTQPGAGAPVYLIKATLSGGQQPSTISHAASHVRTGSDVIDGDRVQIDYVPSYYTRNSSASGAGATTDLTAHLAGIDTKFGTGVIASGGTETTYTDYTGATYKVHSFTSTGNTNFVVTTGGIISVLVVAGGGGGGFDVGGGGGAGGFIYRNSFTITPQTYVVTVGAGGAGATSATTSAANDGGNSVFSSLTATGGGAGGSYSGTAGRNGGSGGGGVGYSAGFSAPGSGTYGQGFSGGASQISAPSTSGNLTASGGGGAGGPGAPGTWWLAGYAHGGSGRYCDITGTDVLYASGGRGAQDTWTGMATSVTNSGNGGDGQGIGGSNGIAGAAGIVIVRYRIS